MRRFVEFISRWANALFNRKKTRADHCVKARLRNGENREAPSVSELLMRRDDWPAPRQSEPLGRSRGPRVRTSPKAQKVGAGTSKPQQPGKRVKARKIQSKKKGKLAVSRSGPRTKE
jgi:hypothetical protein